MSSTQELEKAGQESSASDPPGKAQPTGSGAVENYLVPPVSIFENDEFVTVQADLPGVSKDHVHLHCEQETLTLEGELSVELNPGNSTTAVQAELRTPRFRRSFIVGTELDTQSIKADMKDGVLTIRIPKKPSARPFKIEIS